MVKEFLKKVISMVGGKQAEEIVDFLYKKNYVNEFLISKNLEITINQTRNLLYRVSDRGFLSSIRKKDKKKGWYTYFWKIEILKSLEFLKGVLKERIERTEKQINNRETKNFYVCKRCNIEHNEENALLHDFICIECEQVLDIKDNTKSIRALKRSSEGLKKEIELIDKEIQTEREKINKKRAKEIDKEEKEKAAKRAMRRKTAVKKTVKKTSKKKTTKKISKKKSK